MPDLAYPPNTPAHGMITEWKAADPSADIFRGTRRQVLRIGFFDTIHGIQQIGFNPTSIPGDKDYGLLYIAVGDGGVVGEESPGMVTTVRRICGSRSARSFASIRVVLMGSTADTEFRRAIPLWVNRLWANREPR